jgi:Bacteriophage Mu, Gp27
MEKAQKAKRPYQSHKIRDLPAEVRKQLDERIAKRDFKSYRELKLWLRQHGCQIATLSVQHHALKLDAKLAAVRLATAQARAVVEATGSDELDINHALLRLVQQHLFNLLVELNGTDLTEVNLAALARTVATLARASISQQKFAEEMRSHVLAAQRTVAEAEARGLSEVGVAQIKRILMEITE